MDFLNTILKLSKRFYPNGRAFKMFFESVFEQMHKGLSESENRAVLDGLAVLDGILPDNENFTDQDATDWERRLGLISKPTVTLEERKAAILRKMNHPGSIPARQHYLYFQGQIQLAGFNLWVYENRFDDGSGGFFSKQPFQLVTEVNNPQAPTPFQHGQQQHGYNSGLKVVNFLEEERDAPYIVSNLRQTFFVGGSAPGVYGDVPEARKIELRQLLLLLKPAESVAYLLIYFGDGIFDTINPNQGVGVFGINLYVQGNKLYWLETGQVRVHDVANNVDLNSEKFGSGNITNATAIWIVGSKAYITDNSGTEVVKVFNINSGSYLSGENFGSGVIDFPLGIRVVGDRAYVASASGGIINVFEVSTQTHLSAEDFGAGLLVIPTDVEIFEGKGYVLDAGDNTIKVFDLATGEHLDGEDINSVQFNEPSNFRLVNNLFYVANNSSNEIEVFDRVTRKYLSANSFFALGIAALHIRDKDLYWLDSGFNVINHRSKN